VTHNPYVVITCETCGERGHRASAHTSLVEALDYVDLCLRRGEELRARMWLSVARRLAREQATGRAA